MKTDIFLVLSLYFSSLFGTCVTKLITRRDKIAWQCSNASGTLLYKGLKFKDIIDTYESDPSFLVSTEDLTSLYLKERINSWDMSRVSLILNLEKKDIKGILTGPFTTSPVCEIRFQALISKFKELTGSSVKYAMIPLGTPRSLAKALHHAKVSVIYPKHTIKHDTDLSKFVFRDFIVVDLSIQGLDLIMKLGKHLEDNVVNAFSFKECLSTTLLHREPDKTLIDLQAKLNLMNVHVKASRAADDYLIDNDKWQIRRDHVFEDSIDNWNGHDRTKFIGRTRIEFVDETGDDYGGLTKEWFSLIAREGFGNPNYFDSAVADGKTYIIPTSKLVTDLVHFQFFGNIIAKVISNGHTIGCSFPDFLLRMMMKKSPKFHDLRQLDAQSFGNILINIADGGSYLDVTFSYFRKRGDTGVMEEVDLKPNGRSIKVNEDNKYEYLRLLFDAKIHTAQVASFLQGFQDFSSDFPLDNFTVNELRSFIAGQSKINVQEWKENTIYDEYFNSSSVQSNWFWEIVESFDEPQRRKLLKWISGTENPPLQGFANLRGANGEVCKFKLTKNPFGGPDHLPFARTCYNELRIQVYNSKEQFSEKLELAMNYCNTFTMA